MLFPRDLVSKTFQEMKFPRKHKTPCSQETAVCAISAAVEMQSLPRPINSVSLLTVADSGYSSRRWRFLQWFPNGNGLSISTFGIVQEIEWRKSIN